MSSILPKSLNINKLRDLYADDWYNLYQPLTKGSLMINKDSNNISLDLLNELNKNQQNLENKFTGLEDITKQVEDINTIVGNHSNDISKLQETDKILDKKIDDEKLDTDTKILGIDSSLNKVSSTQDEIINHLKDLLHWEPSQNSN